MEHPTRLERIRHLAGRGPRQAQAAPDLESWPDIPERLVEWLESAYPDRCPEPDVPLDEMWRRSIEVALVRRIRAQYEIQVSERRKRGVI